MANKTITDYTAAITIDPANDYFLIEQSSVYKSINRNVALGLASAPVGLTDAQTLTSKTLTAPTINGATLSGTLSGTYTIGGTPTFPSSVVTLTGSQTLTNKVLTSPTINGGSIDNSTITVDSISGHTTSTVVTVANMQVSNGVINSANAVTATSIAAGAIQPQALVSGTGSGWSWIPYTPTYTVLTVGNGTGASKYTQIGKTVIFKIDFTFGSSSAMGSGLVNVTLPVASTSYGASSSVGTALFINTGIAEYQGITEQSGTLGISLGVSTVSSTHITNAVLSSTSPFIWTTGSRISATIIYEAA